MRTRVDDAIGALDARTRRLRPVVDVELQLLFRAHQAFLRLADRGKQRRLRHLRPRHAHT
jgi:hypothetical protein